MRRAKKPPSAELVGEACVVNDMLLEGRRAEIEHKIVPLVHAAMSEYLRRFPKTRKMNDEPWVDELIGSERDFQCFFCRKSLNTLPAHRSISQILYKKLFEHPNLCGIRMLAGLIDPHPPLKRGEVGL